MKSVRPLIYAAILAGTASTASASDHDIGLNVGSLGIGPQIGWTLSPGNFHGRLSLGLIDYPESAVAEGIEYDGDLELKNIALLGDYYPFGGIFRISAGVIVNDNAFSATGKVDAGDEYTAGGETYTAGAGDTATGEITFDSLAPYIGIGFGRASSSKGLSFTADLGVMSLGGASASIDIASRDPALQAEASRYATSAESALEDELDALALYPVIQVGALYRF